MPDADQNMMGMMGGAPMPATNVMGQQSFDGVVGHNDKSMRRRSMPVSYGSPQAVDVSMRRMTMMDFTAPLQAAPINSFTFDPSIGSGYDTTMTNGLPIEMNGIPRDRRASQADLSINTQLSNQAVYGSMVQPGSAFASPMNVNTSLDMDPTSPYITSGIQLPIDLSMMGNDLSAVDMFATQAFGSPLMASPLQANFTGSMMGPAQDPGGGIVDRSRDALQQPSDNGATPDFRLPGSGTTSHEGSVHPSTGGTSASEGQQTGQMSRIQSQVVPPPLNSVSYTQTVLPNTGVPENMGGAVIPWSTPAGQYSGFLVHIVFPTTI